MALSKLTKVVSTLSLATAFALSTGASADAGYSKLDNWAEKASIAVDDVMEYPRARVRGSGSGTAIFRVTVNDDGDVVASQQLRRPGSVALNAAAKKVVKHADFPALPSGFSRDKLTFELQLRYEMGGPEAGNRNMMRPSRVTSRKLAKGHGPVMASLKILPASAD